MTKVLVVDDEEGLLRTLCFVLEEEGYRAITASNARDGLTLAGKEDPDVILYDYGMLQVDGFSFVEEYRASKGQALVIAMTPYGGNEIAKAAMQEGAYDCLPKPFTADELVLVMWKAKQREGLPKKA